MKIRNYKGSSLESLYEVIYKELGPQAVVVSQSRPKGIGRFFSPHQYELIAVVDDGSADSHILSKTAGLDDIRKITALNREKWETQEKLLSSLRQEIKNISGNFAFPVSCAGKDIPEFAKDWDIRFLKKVRSEMPDTLQHGDIVSRRKEIARLLNVRENFIVKKRSEKPQIIVIVGPTGSGKTTTLAKLAASWCLEQGLNVGLITTDTYRIAAVDQLKEYATLLGLDLKVAFSAGEASNAVRAFTDKDVILVDTPGRNHYDQIGMAGLRGMLRRLGKITVFLVIPAVVDRSNVPEIIRSFGILKPDCLIITKIDEARRFPMLTTVASETTCPVVFVTNGQRVPQDIRLARRAEMANMLLGRIGEKMPLDGESAGRQAENMEEELNLPRILPDPMPKICVGDSR